MPSGGGGGGGGSVPFPGKDQAQSGAEGASHNHAPVTRLPPLARGPQADK